MIVTVMMSSAITVYIQYFQEMLNIIDEIPSGRRWWRRPFIRDHDRHGGLLNNVLPGLEQDIDMFFNYFRMSAHHIEAYVCSNTTSLYFFSCLFLW